VRKSRRDEAIRQFAARARSRQRAHGHSTWPSVVACVAPATQGVSACATRSTSKLAATAARSDSATTVQPWWRISNTGMRMLEQSSGAIFNRSPYKQGLHLVLGAGAGQRAPTLLKRIAADVARAMCQPATAQRLEQQALLPVFDTPDQFAASLKDEQQTWAAFIKQHAISGD
jgi:hypothetical protein